MSNNDCDQTLDNQTSEILPGHKNIESFTKDGYRILMEAIRYSNSLPSGSDWNFYKAHDSFNKIINEDSNNLLTNINVLLRTNSLEASIKNRGSEEKTELMIEANDVILERVANNIDEMNGIRKTVNEPVVIQTVSAQLPINGSWNRIGSATFSVSSSLPTQTGDSNGKAISLLTAKNIVRPQNFFKDKIINSCKFPWEPRIKEKPNSIKPLSIFLEETERGEEFSHPYEFELERFKPPPEHLHKEDPVLPLPVNSTPLIEVNSEEQLNELLEELRKCKEFAVDLEHHSYRSFMGITCLLQISTRDKDYIIDTFSLRDKLYVLNEVFTMPSIVKIFHGAEMDIQWLQRDLSIYVVNMFDTCQAAKMLQYSGRSLAYLMQRFCSFQANKQFQLADWRIRPLPDELKAYAREDTHFLIHIYQRMKNELLDKAFGKDNLLLSVFQNSTNICKMRYFRPILTATSYLDFYRKCKRLFDNRQLFALRELYKWRDEISREEDESTGYVLPNHMLLQISETLPREMQGILACCNPIPPLVRANALEIHRIILKAREQPLEKEILKEDTRARGITKKISKINVDSPLHCPHDLTHLNEFEDDLPTLLGNSLTNWKQFWNKDINIEKSSAIHNIFDSTVDSHEEECSKKKPKFPFLGPFERYKLVKPFIEAEEKKMVEEKAAQESENTPEEADIPNTTTTSNVHQHSVAEEARTDAERIESIREHFRKLSRLPEAPKQAKTLIEMGGTKKRKRDSTSNDDIIKETDLCTTVPNLNINQNNPRKRRSSNSWDFDNNVPSKKVSTQNQQPFGQNQSPGDNRTSNKKKQKYWRGKSNFEPNVDKSRSNKNKDRNSVDSNKRLNANNYNNEQNNTDVRNSPKNKKKNYPQNEPKQEFTPYDYSSVDFRQFEGGANKPSGKREFVTKFRPKGKKNFKGNNNRSSVMGNFGNKSGRGGKSRGGSGRGRGGSGRGRGGSGRGRGGV